MHPCTCRIAATDPASRGSHPYSSFAQGLARADNVLSLNIPGCLFDVITDHPRYAPLGLELENHVEGSISIDILQGRLHRSGLSTGCTKMDPRWVYIGSLNSLGRQNGYRNHIHTFRINGIVQPGWVLRVTWEGHMVFEQRPSAN